MSTTWSASTIAALEAAIASGTKSVSYGDRRVEYQSIAEMLQLLQTMRDQVAASTSSTGGKTIFAGRVCS